MIGAALNSAMKFNCMPSHAPPTIGRSEIASSR